MRLYRRPPLEPNVRPPASALLLLFVFVLFATTAVGGFLIGLGLALHSLSKPAAALIGAGAGLLITAAALLINALTGELR